MTNIAPWLSVTDTAAALAFYRAAFGATEQERHEDDAGNVIVAQLSIGGADFWIQADAGTETAERSGEAMRMILTVEDPDAVYAAAVAAGATEVAPIYEDFGWRIGRIADVSGHHWEIGRRLTA